MFWTTLEAGPKRVSSRSSCKRCLCRIRLIPRLLPVYGFHGSRFAWVSFCIYHSICSFALTAKDAWKVLK